jgi:hypothetical protein
MAGVFERRPRVSDMSDYAIVKGDDPGSISCDDVGPKAYRLIELGRWCRDVTTFQVPSFAIVTAEPSIEYGRRFGAPPEQDYGGTPEPATIGADVKRFFDGFYEINAATFNSCLSYLSGPRAIYIGSSLAPRGAARLSFAGVNSRTTPNSVPRAGSYVKVAVENALSGLFRAYTQLYLDGHGLATPIRPASVMFYEFIEAEYEAVAYVYDGEVHVEWKPLRGQTRSPVPPAQFDLWGSPPLGEYWSANSRGERMRASLQDALALAQCPEGDIVEFEFCFTSTDDLFLLQYRSYPAHHSTLTDVGGNGRAPILGTVGKVVGRPVSLLRSAVSEETVSRIVREQQGSGTGQPIWLVNRHGAGWDPFRLLWAADYANVAPIRLLMCHTHDFYPLHMTAVLREDPRVSFFGELELEGIRPWLNEERLELDSDGLNVLVAPC